MKKDKNRRKLNNQGMSLIEILVAIMILAIVSGPLLHALATSISLNARAKERQRVITMAQSVMEGLKAYDVEEICRQFNSNNSSDMHLVFIREQASVDSEHPTSWYEEPASDHNGDGTVNEDDVSINADGTFVPSPDGTYKFVMTNVRYEGIDVNRDSYYDMLIEISPKTAQVISDVSDMNEYLDAVYTQPMNMDKGGYTKVLEAVLEKINAEVERDEPLVLQDLENLQNYLTVDKLITVEAKESDGISTVTITTIYNYSLTYTYVGDEDSYTFDFSGYVSVDENSDVNVYKANEDSDAKVIYKLAGSNLDNVYIYYYPAYSINGVEIASETINLINNTTDDKNFYLIKQINSSLSTGMLSSYEGDYANKVHVNIVPTSSNSINLYHNLEQNLAFSGDTKVTTPYVPASASGGIISSTQNLFLLYDVKVSFYEAGTAVKGQPFPPEKRLVELDGSMND